MGREKSIFTGLIVILAAACGSSGGSGGGASSLAAGSRANGGGVSGAPGLAGVWNVTGTDPIRGYYQGTAEVAPASSGYTVKHLVTFASPLPSGEQLLWAWNAVAAESSGGLAVTATLVRADVFSQVNSSSRTAADKTPLVLNALLVNPTGAVATSASVGTEIGGAFAGGPTETWTFSGIPSPPFPITSVTYAAGHPAPTPAVKSTLFSIFASYHALPVFAPYVALPAFQAAIHQVILDQTALAFYRMLGPGYVVLVDKIDDDIAVAEETRRAHAFAPKLYVKEGFFDSDLTNVNSDVNGMVTAIDTTTTPPSRDFSDDPVLYSGIWATSQLYRYQVTGSQEAYDNIIRAATGAAICIDITPDKTEFARAVDFLANAQPGQVGPPGSKYGWVAGTGQYSNLMWMYGGNNDMLHGVETSFSCAVNLLPAGHPLLAQIGAQAASLLGNFPDAQSGTHEINLAYAAWKGTGLPQWQTRYQNSLGFKNILDKLYTDIGGPLIQWQGIADWSGHGLGVLTFVEIRLLGGASPNYLEQSWRDVGTRGIAAGFRMSGAYREGLVVALAATAGVTEAVVPSIQVLDEIPYPKQTGNSTIDCTINPGFSYSPYPSDPWYLDWMTNTMGRIQGLYAYPYFYRASATSFFNRSPLVFSGSPDLEEEPGQDYLCSYWMLRQGGVLGPND